MVKKMLTVFLIISDMHIGMDQIFRYRQSVCGQREQSCRALRQGSRESVTA